MAGWLVALLDTGQCTSLASAVACFGSLCVGHVGRNDDDDDVNAGCGVGGCGPN